MKETWGLPGSEFLPKTRQRQTLGVAVQRMHASAGQTLKAEFHLEVLESLCVLKLFNHNNEMQIAATGDDFFFCLSETRKSLPCFRFLCKGAKIKVFPSWMPRQMGKGLHVYECVMGKPATKNNMVNIFDFESENLVQNSEDQIEYHKAWLDSLINN